MCVRYQIQTSYTFPVQNTVRCTHLPQMVKKIQYYLLSWHICLIGSLCWFSLRLIINNAVKKFMLHCKGVRVSNVASQYMSDCKRNWWPGGTAKIYLTKNIFQCSYGSVWIYMCVFSLWLKLGVNGLEHDRNDRFEELPGYMSCVNFQSWNKISWAL